MNVMPLLARRSPWLAGRVLLLWLGVALVARGEDRTYVVKPSDTLYGLAQQHGLTVSQLASRNGISRDTHLYVGQRLIIPDLAPAAVPAPSALGATVQRAVTRAPVSPGRWKYIVIHHSGTDAGNFKSLDRYHREERHMENGLAYHFLIGNGNGMGDGEIAVGNRWTEQLDGGHLRSEEQNKIALGICLIGNFEHHLPTAKQMRSLEQLTRALMQRCKLGASAVRTHQQINIVRTECPGEKFPTRSFLAKLKTPAN